MYIVYKDRTGQWRWQYTSNGRIIADSGESYYNKADCLRGVGIMKASTNSQVVER